MNRNAVTLLAAILFAAVAIAHFLRIVFEVPITVGDTAIPMWVSGVAAIVPGVLAWLLYKNSRQP